MTDTGQAVRDAAMGERAIVLMRAYYAAEDARNNCPECENEGPWEHCEPCSERIGNAINDQLLFLAEVGTTEAVGEETKRFSAYAKDIAATVVQEACETEPADPDCPDVVMIHIDDLEAIVRSTVDNAHPTQPPTDAAAAREDAMVAALTEAHRIALHHSNYGHGEGNRRAFAIASDIEKRIPVRAALPITKGEG